VDDVTRTYFDQIGSSDGQIRFQAFMALLTATDVSVDWAYEAWDELVQYLHHKDNHVRAIAAQLLANLAQSDPEQRMLRDFDALFAVTRDERFVTARHALQSIWRVGTAGKRQQERVVGALSDRFAGCSAEKNCTLVRYDIIVNMKRLYDAVKDEAIRQQARRLIETEQDLKYRRKYSRVWGALLRADTQHARKERGNTGDS
jgi:hypothetical protein